MYEEVSDSSSIALSNYEENFGNYEAVDSSSGNYAYEESHDTFALYGDVDEFGDTDLEGSCYLYGKENLSQSLYEDADDSISGSAGLYALKDSLNESDGDKAKEGSKKKEGRKKVVRKVQKMEEPEKEALGKKGKTA